MFLVTQVRRSITRAETPTVTKMISERWFSTWETIEHYKDKNWNKSSYLGKMNFKFSSSISLFVVP